MSNIFGKLSQNLSGNKLVLVGAAVATTAVMGSAGVAAAQSWHHHWHHNTNPAAVRFCKSHYRDLGFKNKGQCVSAFQHHKGHGYGYGNNHHGKYGQGNKR